jgi:hypothetical protein
VNDQGHTELFFQRKVWRSMKLGLTVVKQFILSQAEEAVPAGNRSSVDHHKMRANAVLIAVFQVKLHQPADIEGSVAMRSEEDGFWSQSGAVAGVCLPMIHAAQESFGFMSLLAIVRALRPSNEYAFCLVATFTQWCCYNCVV